MKELKPNFSMIGLIFGMLIGVAINIGLLVDGRFNNLFPAWISVLFFLFGVISGFGFSRKLKNIYESHKYIPKEISQKGLIAFGPAKYFQNKKNTTGWLYLTKENLIFIVPSIASLSETTTTIPIKDIRGWQGENTFSVIPNKIRIEKTNGIVEVLTVSRRDEWLEFLNSLIVK